MDNLYSDFVNDLSSACFASKEEIIEDDEIKNEYENIDEEKQIMSCYDKAFDIF